MGEALCSIPGRWEKLMGIIGPALGLAIGAFSAGSAYQSRKGMPPTPQTPPMPDQTIIDQTSKKSAAMQLSRTGRASTVLSAGSDTGDRLGP